MTIQFKRSCEPGLQPAPCELKEGELALNLADGLIFSKDCTGAVITVGGGAGDIDGGSYDDNLVTPADCSTQTLCGTVSGGQYSGTCSGLVIPAPTNVTVTAGDRTFTLSWTPPTPPDGFTIDAWQIDVTPSVPNAFIPAGGSVSTFLVSDLPNNRWTVTNAAWLVNGTQYAFRVRAVCTVRQNTPEGTWSSTVLATPAATVSPPSPSVAIPGAVNLRGTLVPPATTPTSGYTILYWDTLSVPAGVTVDGWEVGTTIVGWPNSTPPATPATEVVYEYTSDVETGLPLSKDTTHLRIPYSSDPARYRIRAVQHAPLVRGEWSSSVTLSPSAP